VTGVRHASSNTKTGAMLQTWIIRSDMTPISANRLGLDHAICGRCPLRGLANLVRDTGLADGRACYVNLRCVQSIFRAFQRGSYPDATTPQQISAIGSRRVVRLGAYGDQSAVPGDVARYLLSDAESWTAYSHQSANPNSSFDPKLYMVSADSLREAQSFWSAGARTFRVVASVDQIDKSHEILCPASEEAGFRTQCIRCKLCKGASINAKSIAIPVHGSGARNFVQIEEAIQ
jgi:hypothetical protein